MIWIAAIIALVSLTSPFGEAEAAAIGLDGGLTIEVIVEVNGTFEAVLVRPHSSFEELPPTALGDNGDGTWSGRVVLPTAEDWSVLFDALEAGGGATRSDSVTLTALGVDPVVVGGEPEGTTPRDSIDASTWWLIAAVILALCALGALAWWTFASDEREDESSSDPEHTSGEPHT